MVSNRRRWWCVGVGEGVASTNPRGAEGPREEGRRRDFKRGERNGVCGGREGERYHSLAQ